MKNLMLLLLLVIATRISAQSGTQRTYYPNGTVKEAKWVDEGRVFMLQYHENGRIAQRGSFIQGRPDGLWKRYDASGKLLDKVRFTNGLRNGKCMYTNIDGSTRYQMDYAQGKLVHCEQLDVNGDMVAERDMR